MIKRILDKKNQAYQKRTFIKKGFPWFLIIALCPTFLFSQDIESFQLGEPTTAIQPIKWTGEIYSTENREPIINAVLQSDGGINGITNLDGKFEIVLTKKNHVFPISALGFEEKKDTQITL